MDESVFSLDEAKTLLMKKQPTLSLMHLNIRSIRKHHDDLIALLCILDHAFSFICLSETWLYHPMTGIYTVFQVTRLNIAIVKVIVVAVQPF